MSWTDLKKFNSIFLWKYCTCIQYKSLLHYLVKLKLKMLPILTVSSANCCDVSVYSNFYSFIREKYGRNKKAELMLKIRTTAGCKLLTRSSAIAKRTVWQWFKIIKKQCNITAIQGHQFWYQSKARSRLNRPL